MLYLVFQDYLLQIKNSFRQYVCIRKKTRPQTFFKKWLNRKRKENRASSNVLTLARKSSLVSHTLHAPEGGSAVVRVSSWRKTLHTQLGQALAGAQCQCAPSKGWVEVRPGSRRVPGRQGVPEPPQDPTRGETQVTGCRLGGSRTRVQSSRFPFRQVCQ